MVGISESDVEFHGCFSTKAKAELFIDYYPSAYTRMCLKIAEFTIDEYEVGTS